MSGDVWLDISLFAIVIAIIFSCWRLKAIKKIVAEQREYIDKMNKTRQEIETKYIEERKVFEDTMNKKIDKILSLLEK